MASHKDNPNWIVYLITNTVNGKNYVGITCRPLEVRWKAHLFRASHNWKQILYNAIRKYGSEAFSLKIIDRADSLLNAGILESHHIIELGAYYTEHGYNMTYGGEGTLGWDPTPEWRAAVSKREKGRKMSEERKQEYSVKFSGTGNPRYGVTLSEATKENIRTGHKKRAEREGRIYKGTPVRLGPKKYYMVTYNGETKNLAEWCRILNLNYARVKKRVSFYALRPRQTMSYTYTKMSEQTCWIQTFSGISFNPLKPKIDDVHIEDIAHSLSMQCRFNGHIKKFYSVGEHCVRVSWIVPAQYALWGLLHDAGETYFSDLPSPIKNASDIGTAYRAYEATLMAVICDKFGLNRKEPADVKKADLILLMTEKRDLLGEGREPWYGGADVECLKERIFPWPQEIAEARFLARFKELYRPDATENQVL